MIPDARFVILVVVILYLLFCCVVVTAVDVTIAQQKQRDDAGARGTAGREAYGSPRISTGFLWIPMAVHRIHLDS